MTVDTISRASGHAYLWAFLAVLTLAGGAAAAEARGITPERIGQTVAAVQPAVLRAQARLAPLSPMRQRALVWHGADVDGDGQDDFLNPTGLPPRDHDGFGSGAFGASRDGGAREHEGVDYVAVAGQAVKAPISGFVSKIGYAYAGDDLRFVEISNPALRYVTRVFYVEPFVRVGQPVRLGQTVGEAVSLQARYAGITDHVHLEIMPTGGARVDAAELITASYEPRPSAGSGRRMALR